MFRTAKPTNGLFLTAIKIILAVHVMPMKKENILNP